MVKSLHEFLTTLSTLFEVFFLLYTEDLYVISYTTQNTFHLVFDKDMIFYLTVYQMVVAGFSIPGISLRGLVGFMVDKVTLRQGFLSENSRFPSVVHPPMVYVHTPSSAA